MSFFKKKLTSRDDQEKFRLFIERKEVEAKEGITKAREEAMALIRELGFFRGVISGLRAQGKTADCSTCLEACSLMSVAPCGHYSCTQW